MLTENGEKEREREGGRDGGGEGRGGERERGVGNYGTHVYLNLIAYTHFVQTPFLSRCSCILPLILLFGWSVVLPAFH